MVLSNFGFTPNQFSEIGLKYSKFLRVNFPKIWTILTKILLTLTSQSILKPTLTAFISIQIKKKIVFAKSDRIRRFQDAKYYFFAFLRGV